MPATFTLTPVDELNEMEPRGFDLAPPDQSKRVLIIKKDDKVYAYRNVCPHAGAPLNWYGDRFLDSEKRYIQCALHGAIFRIIDGYCIAGPCSGQSLTSVPFFIENNEIKVKL